MFKQWSIEVETSWWFAFCHCGLYHSPNIVITYTRGFWPSYIFLLLKLSQLQVMSRCCGRGFRILAMLYVKVLFVCLFVCPGPSDLFSFIKWPEHGCYARGGKAAFIFCMWEGMWDFIYPLFSFCTAFLSVKRPNQMVKKTSAVASTINNNNKKTQQNISYYF